MYRFAEIALAVLVLAAGAAHIMATTSPSSPAAVAPTPRAADARRASWSDHLTIVDDALAIPDVSAAVIAWYDAYGAALATRRWEPMVHVGDAFMQIGAVAGSRDGARANARQAYLVALMRAQRERSVDGALQVAEAFAALGDRGVAMACAQVAKGIAEERQDRLGLERVRVFTAARLPEPS